VKDKEINLTKVSTASEIERFKLQFTQMNNAKIEKLNQLKIAEKRMSDLTAQITNKSVLI
jgi:FlaA1/EpsC-like NDP-sugar epimerase